ncbi:HAMP domain-containing sensor histidine kinase [Pseudonocardia sp.]|uniref:sensor histidine kinase n=1 Tax=Pseudonocardia sp. TaxID=60912 RepID=UPI002636152F|nr:HAMP domain-containing sensor histidine kinase [Pseudonocardia sp.]
MTSTVRPATSVVSVTTRPAAPDAATVEHRLGLPARARIMAWLLLLLTVALVSVVLVTRNLLLADLDAEITAELQQESEEFTQFVDVGVNPETGLPFANAVELMKIHLERQRPGEDQVQVGVFADGTSPQAQGRASRLEAMDADVLATILAATVNAGEVTTAEGPVRWARTPLDIDPDAVDGYFIVGELLDPPRADIDESIRTLAIVSAIGLLLAGVASWIVSGQILAPLRLVRRTAEEITEDDLSRRIPVTGNDDLSALADRFNAMLDRLQRAFATQREFVDDAGHELRTPITIIRGNLEVMGLGNLPGAPTERAEVVRLCTDELDRMSRIVEDLLVLAKSERPDFVRPAPVELAELTSDIDAKVRSLADRHWVLETCGEGAVRIDAQRITQAVVQFAQNAVQHTEVGATIRIGSAVERRAGVDTVSVWVADTGPGVRAEDAEGIFERFSRGSTGGARSHRSGAGLGLAIVRAIAEAHGGRVRLDSVPGAGARFTIEVPAAPPAG